MPRLPAITRPHGYHGRALWVDLTSEESQWRELAEGDLRRFLGGSGLGTYLLLREDVAQQDPLGAECALVFAFSPLVGSPLTTSAKFAIVCKSPLTRRISDSLVSSAFALAGKRAGCDAIVLRGRAARPSVLVIDDGRMRLEPAVDLWGSSCTAGRSAGCANVTEPSSRRRSLVRPANARCVSPPSRTTGAMPGAAEAAPCSARRTSKRYSCVVHSVARGPTRQGLSPAPNGSPPIRSDRRQPSIGNWARPRICWYSTGCTPCQRGISNRAASKPRPISPETLSSAHARRARSCAACTIGCEHLYAFTSDKSQAVTTVRVEYENLFALGALCGIGNFTQVLQASRLCDDLGLDTISAGGTIAFAMECAERGILDAPWLRFGSGEALLRALRLTGRREGLGNAWHRAAA